MRNSAEPPTQGQEQESCSGDNPPGLDVGFSHFKGLAVGMGVSVDTLLARMAAYGVSKGQVLCFLNATRGMRQEEIADCLGVSQQAVSGMIQRLVTKFPELASYLDGSAFSCVVKQYTNHMDVYVQAKF